MIERAPEGRSTYRLSNYNQKSGWAKLPAKSMYAGAEIVAFRDFRLRRRVELDALKLFFLFASLRDQKTNLTRISYDRIQHYTDIERFRIKTAISFLASLSLVYVEHLLDVETQHIFNAYRLVGLESYSHMGTRGRSMEAVPSVAPFGR